MALIPEDRKTEGLMLPMSVGDNLSFAALDNLSRAGIIDRAAEAKAIDEMIRLLGIRTAGTDIPVASLSGGNQQKVVIAKWLMVSPRIILLNDPTRGIDVGTKQEMYQLLRKLADSGAAIIFYSTDYDELIGCCDRVLVLYDGSVVKVLSGQEITEHALVSSALNVGGEGRGSRQRGEHGVSDWRFRFQEHKATLLAVARLLRRCSRIYIGNHPAGLTANVATTAANKAVLLALVAMAQTLPVLTGGLDLSVGMVFVLANCVASAVVVENGIVAQTFGLVGITIGASLETAIGIVLVLLLGLACGAINGIIVVYGRLQPIITTLATGAIYFGFALWLRPVPGGAINYGLADVDDRQAARRGPGARRETRSARFPVTLIVLLVVVLVVWMPYRRSMIGRAAYAVGSSEQAAYMSGVPVRRAKLLAYTLSGLLAAIGGLFLTFLTYSGEASAPIGGTYTLNSIAAVVIGGTSLFGGVGSAIGSIFGAFVLRTIGDLLFVFDMDPLWQPLFQGVILLVAVSLGSIRLLQIRNRLELFG